MVDLDVFHEMAHFREAISLGEIPIHDLYSYIPTKDIVVDHEWGNGALLYTIVVKLGLGSGGLLFLKYFLSIALVILCYKFSILHGGDDYIKGLIRLWRCMDLDGY